MCPALRGRIIPAYAGSTIRGGTSTRAARDHPRVCGEHRPRPRARGVWAGSSPRMRGAHSDDYSSDFKARIIPAYAGSTALVIWALKQGGDHPRVCGEHVNLDRHGFVNLGIIPAYAGSTTHWVHIRYHHRDHPRVCGEHRAKVLYASRVLESSPRMRGAPISSTPSRPSTGIIPAYAGSTRTTLPLPSVSGDHPRVCGEHLTFTVPFSTAPGSSPRMRGAQVFPTFVGMARRIIPAYAGSTALFRPSHHRNEDHPRVCGEHSTLLASFRASPGSSPRMRGARSTWRQLR